VDAEAYRADARERWDRAAAGWERRREVFQRASEPVSMWLVEHARLQPGDRVLELAAGPGDTGLLAAEVVRPGGGTVLLTDTSEAMVAAARRRAEALGARNVEARTMDAEFIDLDTASLDAVLCRWGYMLLADPVAALKETRRVLRPGGRVALAAWTAADDNPWLTTIPRALVELGLAEPPAPGEPGPTAFAEPGRIAALLEQAGFAGAPDVASIGFAFTFPSIDAYWEHQLDMSTRLGEQTSALSPADHTRLRDRVDERLAPYVRTGGALALPARTWVAAADA